MIDQWATAFSEFSAAHADLAGPGLFLIAFASALFLVGVLVPVTASMLAAGAAVALGQWPPSTALWAMAGLSAGSVLSYECGRLAPERSRVRLAKAAPRTFAVADELVRRYGAASVVVSRFIGPPATIPFIAGYLGLSRVRFLIATMIAALWAPAVMAIGYAIASGAL